MQIQISLSQVVFYTGDAGGGDLATAVAETETDFITLIAPCTEAPSCTGSPLPEPSGTCHISIQKISPEEWTDYNDIYDDICKLTPSIPKSTRPTLCNLTKNIGYMTNGNVWNGTISSISGALKNLFTECCDEHDASANKIYSDLKRSKYIQINPISVPNVDSDISAVIQESHYPNILEPYSNYRSWFNDMRVWLQIYYGPQVGVFLVNVLSTSYQDWYNKNYIDPMPADISYTNLTKLIWTPTELAGTELWTPTELAGTELGNGAIDRQVTALQQLLNGPTYIQFKNLVILAQNYQAIISEGKYTLALGMEYADAAGTPAAELDKKYILDVLQELPDKLKTLVTNLQKNIDITNKISDDFLNILIDPNQYLPDFSRNIDTAITAILKDKSLDFDNSFSDIKQYIDASYSKAVDTINT